MPGETMKYAGLMLLEDISKAVFEWLDLFHQWLGTRSKAIDQIMSKFVIIQPIFSDF